jgi:hypothetical protein
MNRNYAFYLCAGLALVTTLLLITVWLWTKRTSTSLKHDSEITISVKEGNTDTLRFVKKIAGEKQMQRRHEVIARGSTFGCDNEKNNWSPGKNADDTSGVFETEIADSGFSLHIQLVVPTHDTSPPMLTYSGLLQSRELRRVDTVKEVVRSIAVSEEPWYETFYAGAAAVIVVLGAFLVLIK